MILNKVIVISLSLILLFGVVGFANVDIGLYQDFNDTTMFRFDTAHVLVQSALDFTKLRVGVKKNLLSKVYLKADLGFKTNTNDNMVFNNLALGFGYAIEEFGQKFRVEGAVVNPVFTNLQEFEYNVGIGWQFSLPFNATD